MSATAAGHPLCQDKVYNERLNTPSVYFGDIRGRRVLDVGCGAGQLAAFLQRQENHCYGITTSHQEAEIARTKMQEVMVGDLEQMELLPFPEQFFDVAIFSDVLEHLRNPQHALKLVQPYLKPNGLIVASIPNVANVVVRLNLLRGRFDYEPFGIMDETHLRFYTLKTAKQLLISTGYRVYDVKATHWNWRLPMCVRKLLVSREWEMKQRMARWWPGLFASQFVIYAMLPVQRPLRQTAERL